MSKQNPVHPNWLCKVLSCLAIFGLLCLSLTSAQAEDSYLDPEQAFKFSARMVDGKTAEVTYQIANGYYMYRERFKFAAEGAKLGVPAFPKGIVKHDETFDKDVETYHDKVVVKIPVEGNGSFTLSSTGQGCAEKGLCYAPMESQIKLTASNTQDKAAAGSNDKAAGGDKTGGGKSMDLATPKTGVTAPAAKIAAPTTETPATPATASPSDNSATAVADVAKTATLVTNSNGASDPSASGNRDASVPSTAAVAATTAEADAQSGAESESDYERAIRSRDYVKFLPLFWILGLGLSLTPCVFPLVPILSRIIMGEAEHVTRLRGLTLSATYSLGVVVVYTLLGVLASKTPLAAALQNPTMLLGFAALLIILSLSMFDVYELQMPAAIQNRLMQVSDRQSGGKLLGVFVMGLVSALIVGPCVTAPLATVLLYISKTGDIAVGASGLAAIGTGMCTPLLLMGLSAGWLLPRAGVWMDAIKRFFGVVIIATALWIAQPVLPAALQMICWSVLLVAYASFLLWGARSGWMAKALGLMFAVLGLVQLVGVSTGGRDPLDPLAHFTGKAKSHTEFVRVKSTAELDAVLAHTGGKPVMLDFYADWCVSCKEMEKLTFPDSRVQSKFANMVLLQVDVTANSNDDKALLKRFNLFGPPGIIFFNKNGQELRTRRVVGFQDADKFVKSVSAAAS